MWCHCKRAELYKPVVKSHLNVCVSVHREETPSKTDLFFFFRPEDSRLTGRINKCLVLWFHSLHLRDLTSGRHCAIWFLKQILSWIESLFCFFKSVFLCVWSEPSLSSIRGSEAVLSLLSPGGAEGAVGGEEERAQTGTHHINITMFSFCYSNSQLPLVTTSKQSSRWQVTDTRKICCSEDISTLIVSTGVPQETQGRQEEAKVLPEELRIMGFQLDFIIRSWRIPRGAILCLRLNSAVSRWKTWTVKKSSRSSEYHIYILFW